MLHMKFGFQWSSGFRGENISKKLEEERRLQKEAGTRVYYISPSEPDGSSEPKMTKLFACKFRYNRQETEARLEKTQNLHNMSLVMRKPTFWFPTLSDTNQAVQLQKMVRSLKFQT